MKLLTAWMSIYAAVAYNYKTLLTQVFFSQTLFSVETSVSQIEWRTDGLKLNNHSPRR